MPATPAEIARRALADHLAARPASELLKRYAARQDPEAFAGLVQQFGPMVFGVCRRVLGPSADVDDAFQAVFLSLARQAGSFRDAQALPAWLHRVALRVAHKALARRAAGESPEAVPDPADPFADVAWKDVRRVLDEELDRLPDKYRGPVVLCWLDGLTQDEAAGRVGISLATLKRRLEAGRELLRARLVQRGLAPMLAVAAVADSAGLKATVPESLKVLTVELGVGGPVPSGVTGLVVSATGPSRRAVLAALFGASAVAAGGLAYAWNRSQRQPAVSTAPAPAPQPSEPRLVTVAHAHLALNDPDARVPPYVAWSPDGKRIATSRNGMVRLWDAHTGTEVGTPLSAPTWGMDLHPGGNLLAFRPERKTVPGAGPPDRKDPPSKEERKDALRANSIIVWDFAAGTEVAILTSPYEETWPGSPHWSPDGKTLAALGEGRGMVPSERGGLREGNVPVIRIWDIETKKAREIELSGPVGKFGGTPAYSPNGRFLAIAAHSGRHDAVEFRDVATGSKIGELRIGELRIREDQIGEHRIEVPIVFFRAAWWSEDSTTFFVKYGHTGPLKSFNLATRSAREETLDRGIRDEREELAREMYPVEEFLDWSKDGNVCAVLKPRGEREGDYLIEDWRARRVCAIVKSETLWPKPSRGRGREVGIVELSPNGTTLVTYRAGDVLLWDVGKVPLPLPGNGPPKEKEPQPEELRPDGRPPGGPPGAPP